MFSITFYMGVVDLSFITARFSHDEGNFAGYIILFEKNCLHSDISAAVGVAGAPDLAHQSLRRRRGLKAHPRKAPGCTETLSHVHFPSPSRSEKKEPSKPAEPVKKPDAEAPSLRTGKIDKTRGPHDEAERTSLRRDCG